MSLEIKTIPARTVALHDTSLLQPTFITPLSLSLAEYAGELLWRKS
jgi:hypothetical protein